MHKLVVYLLLSLKREILEMRLLPDLQSSVSFYVCRIFLFEEYIFSFYFYFLNSVWAGIRYIATACSALLRFRNILRPVAAVEDFFSEFHMVSNCHKERRLLLDNNPHLVSQLLFIFYIFYSMIIDIFVFLDQLDSNCCSYGFMDLLASSVWSSCFCNCTYGYATRI